MILYYGHWKINKCHLQKFSDLEMVNHVNKVPNIDPYGTSALISTHEKN